MGCTHRFYIYIGCANPLPASGPFPPFRGTQSFVLPATAVTKRNGLVPGKREGGPSVWTVDRFLHRPYDSLLPFWWMGSYTDPASNTVVKRQRGVRTPYPQAGPFPLSGGHKLRQVDFWWPRRALSPFFCRTGRLLFVVSVAGDTNLFVLSVNLPFPFLPVVLQWTGMQVR